MKKYIRFILIVCSLFLLTAVTAQADELLLPKGLKTIEEEAFQGNTLLDQVILPRGLESIGVRAFAESSVNSIQIPGSVSVIGKDAFLDCDNLDSIYFMGTQETWDALAARSGISMPEHVTVYCLGAEIVNSGTCGAELSWTQDANGLLIISGTGEMTDYSYSNNSPWDESQISSVMILPGVTSIGDRAFYSGKIDSNIASVTIPESVEKIGRMSFYFSNKLNEVVLPSHLKTIGAESFGYCTELAEISIPAEVNQIGDGAFEGCGSLENIFVSKDNSYFQSNDGILFANEGKTILAYPAGKKTRDFIIPEGVTEIANSAFKNCSVQTLIMPETITRIGSESFYNCYNLKAAAVPDGIESLPRGVFAYCGHLTQIGIPASVKEISDKVFDGCDELTDVYYPGSENEWNAITIGAENDPLSKASFHWNTEFSAEDVLYTYFTFTDTGDDTCTVSKYTGFSDAVFIPGTNKEGKTVTAIGSSAFSAKPLSSIIIPDTVTVIGDSAFAYCNSLTEIELPASVTTLGKQVFDYCENLERVSLPEGLTAIPAAAFRGCAKLEEINLPSALSSINQYAFYDCKSLTSALLPEGLTSIGNYAFSKCTGLLSITIPDNCTSIGINAFSNCTGVTFLHLGNSLSNIGTEAFYNCTGISSVAFPEGLKVLNNGIFGDCTGLEEITIPESVMMINENAFRGCTSLSAVHVDEKNSVFYESDGMIIKRSPATVVLCPRGKTGECTVPEGVTSIGAGAFMDCSSLTSVLLPESLVSIGANAFKNCSSLETIRIPKDVSEVGENAFDGCSGLKTTYILKDGYVKKWFWENGYYGKLIEYIVYIAAPIEDFTFEAIDENSCKITGYTGQGGNIELPAQNGEGVAVTAIGDNAFKQNSTITAVKLPEGITEIGSYAFYDCKLTELVLPQGLLSIGSSAFNGCYFLAELVIPDTVSVIGSSAFSNCHGLKAVTIPGSVKLVQGFSLCNFLEEVYILDGAESIESGCFSKCEKLTRVELPDTVTAIGSRAFAECSSLETVRVPGVLQRIGDSAFSECARLKTFSIPQTVTEIGAYAFYKCSSLTELDVPNVGVIDNSFSDCVNLISLNFANGITEIELDDCSALTTLNIPDSVTSLALYSFTELKELHVPDALTTLRVCHCPALTSLHVPDTVTSLKVTGDSGLTEINLPSSLTKIESYAFDGTISLTSIQIPETVTEIEDYAFYESGLISIEIPDSVKTIGGYVFYNCNSLESVTLSSGLTKIPIGTFRYCSKLENVSIHDSVTEIGQYAFSDCTSLRSIELPESLTLIDSDAFYKSGLEAITIPCKVKNLNGCFRECRDLVSVTFEDGRSSSLSVASWTFNGCSNLRYVYASDNVWKKIDFSMPAFDQCESLYAFDFPNYTYANMGWNFGECVNLTCVRIPEEIKLISDSYFEECPNLSLIYCAQNSAAWNWALKNGYTPTDADWPYDSRASGLDLSNAVVQGSFSEEEITMKAGQTVQLSGEVTSTGARISRVTITIDDYHIEGDDNDRYATKDYLGVWSFSLDEHSEFTLDGTKAPFNTPGIYTVNLWAENMVSDGVKLATMRVKVYFDDAYQSWTGYVQGDKAETFAGMNATIPNGYISNAKPVTVLNEKNNRYFIEITAEDGTTDLRWVDTGWIGETEWTEDTVILSGSVFTLYGTPLEGVNVCLFNADKDQILGSAVTRNDGSWRISDIRKRDSGLLLFSDARYTFEPASEEIALQESHEIPSIIASYAETGGADCSVEFTMDKSSIMVGEQVVFTVTGNHATNARLVVDGIQYETISLKDGQGTFTRTFNKSGVRKVQMYAGNADGYGALTDVQELNIGTNGSLKAAAFTCDLTGVAGVDKNLTWQTEDTVGEYTLYVYFKENLLLEKKISGDQTSYRLEGSMLYQPGEYAIELISAAPGFDQKSLFGMLSVQAGDTVQVTGTFLDEKKQPIQDVQIRISAVIGTGFADADMTASTDENGQFQIELVPHCSYSLFWNKQGYVFEENGQMITVGEDNMTIDNVTGQKTGTDKIYLSAPFLVHWSDANTQFVEVYAVDTWEAKSENNWISVRAEDNLLWVTMEKNWSGEDRFGTVQVSCRGETIELPIRQEAEDTLTIQLTSRSSTKVESAYLEKDVAMKLINYLWGPKTVGEKKKWYSDSVSYTCKDANIEKYFKLLVGDKLENREDVKRSFMIQVRARLSFIVAHGLSSEQLRTLANGLTQYVESNGSSNLTTALDQIKSIAMEMYEGVDLGEYFAPDQVVAEVVAAGTMRNLIETRPADYLWEVINSEFDETGLKKYNISDDLAKSAVSNSGTKLVYTTIPGLSDAQMRELASQLRKMDKEVSQ